MDSADKFDIPGVVTYAKNELNGLANKVDIYKEAEFDTNCFLDIDTEIRQPLDFGFEMAERHKMAVVIAPACSAIDARPKVKGIPDGMPQYNTGVIFFKKCPEVEAVFDRWREIVEANPQCAKNDQPAFALAIHQLGFNPFCLPRNFNYRAKVRMEGLIHGHIKILHSR